MLSCSEGTELITFCSDASFSVFAATDKTYVSRGIVFIERYFRKEDNKIFYFIFQDEKSLEIFSLAFSSGNFMKNKKYYLLNQKNGLKLLHICQKEKDKRHKVTLLLAERKKIEFDFKKQVLSDHKTGAHYIASGVIDSLVDSSEVKLVADSTRLWFDRQKKHLNNEQKGLYLGKFQKIQNLLFFQKMVKFMFLKLI